jgi:hypothetical protein
MYNQKNLAKVLPIKLDVSHFGFPRNRLSYYVLRVARRGDKEQKNGFIMYVVLLLVLTVMGTTFALANRTASGLAGLTRQSSLRDAELAAENGLIRTINDMNQPANRYLWGIKSSEWKNWYYDGYKKSNLYPLNDCRNNFLPYNNDAFAVTGQAEVFQHIADRASNTANYQEEWTKGFVFQVLAVRLKDSNRNLISDFSTISKLNPSYVEFRVRGTHNSMVNETTGFASSLDRNYRTGAGQSLDHDVSFDIVREYVLVPFCCKTGFLYNGTSSSYGSKRQSCDTNTATTDTSGREKVGWVIVGPSATGVYREALQ